MCYFNILLTGYYYQTMNYIQLMCVFKNSVYLCILLTPKRLTLCFYSLFSSQYKKEVESSDQNTSIG